MEQPRIYLPGLNGLRAIAALSVVVSHTDLLPGVTDFGLDPLFNFSIPMGAFAVTLFFVISGFLITYLLVNEVNLKKDVSIKKFYMRRILRIWPIYYLFLILALPLFWILQHPKNIITPDMFYFVFFSANVPFILKHGGIAILVHYWSIGVEEQFYLFWPWVVHFVRRRLLPVSIIIFAVLFVLKVFLWHLHGSEFWGYRIFFVNRFDCMMVGAIGAILYFNKNKRFIAFFTHRLSQLFAWLLYISVSLNWIHIPLPISHEIVAVAALSIIMGQVNGKNRIVNLEKKGFDFLGKISYGIYVIHPVILLLLSRIFYSVQLTPLIKYPLVFVTSLICVILIAWLSYTYFEKPFLRLKNRFAIVRSSNSMFNK